MHEFRNAVEAKDLEALLALLAEDVVLRSPIVFGAYQGRESVGAVLHAVGQVFEDFSYQREIGAPSARDRALIFEARVGDKQIEGCDFIHVDQDGLIDELVVMVRPLSAAHALTDAMKELLEASASS